MLTGWQELLGAPFPNCNAVLVRMVRRNEDNAGCLKAHHTLKKRPSINSVLNTGNNSHASENITRKIAEKIVANLSPCF